MMVRRKAEVIVKEKHAEYHTVDGQKESRGYSKGKTCIVSRC